MDAVTVVNDTPPKLYSKLAHLWPLLSPPADYAAEATEIRRIVRQHLGEAGGDGVGRLTLLELGAGGGHTLSHLSDEFAAVAVDVSPAMIELSKTLNRGVEHHVGDMRSVRLRQRFDVVLAHDAIDYMQNEDDLRAAFATAAAHLRPGGLFLVAPTYTSETFVNHQTEQDARQCGGIELTYVSYVRYVDAEKAIYELVMLILVREGDALDIEQDRHVCGLFGEAMWLQLLQEAGFEAAIEAGVGPWRLFRAAYGGPELG